MNIFDFTPDTIKDNQAFAWQALEAALNHAPGEISANLKKQGYTDAPANGTDLYNWVQYMLSNGNLQPANLQIAMSQIPVSAPKNNANFDWATLGQIAGVVLGTLYPPTPGANNNAAANQANAAAAQAQLQQQKNMNNILLIGGILVVVVVVLMIWKKK